MVRQMEWRFFIPFLLFENSYCLEPISTTAVVGGILISSGYAGYEYIKCQYWECCDDHWINPNIDVLERDLMTNLHGQHLVNFTISRSIRGHLRNRNPKKALVMAFHGWTGSGKNYASKIIVENLFKKGTKSKFVHWYIATHHFPHVGETEKYKEKLRKEIREYTKLCGRSIFVFDEVDKMPAGVIDAIKPYIDYYEDIDGIDYRRNIFIFLSNTGGSEISKLTYFSFWVHGRDREEITMSDIEPLISKGAFNEAGGLQNSDIIIKNLIDIYVPFLPLEKKHVILCIEDELRSRSKFTAINDVSLINKIADQLQYWPNDLAVFSTSGCKKVSHKVDLYA